MEIGVTGERADFRVRMDFDPHGRGGDLEGANWTMWCGNDQGKTDLTEAPDLAPVETVAYPDVVRDGQTELTYRIENQGFGPAAGFQTEVVLSRNGLIGDEDDLVVDTLDLNALPAGEAATGTLVLDLPRDVLNDWAEADDPPGGGAGYQCTNVEWIGLVLDPDDLIEETDEDNNIGQEKGTGKDHVTYFPWDIDHSAVVTPTDAIFAINRLGDSGPEMDGRADFDGNGVVTPTDAIAVINRLGYEMNTDVVEVEPAVASTSEVLSDPNDAIARLPVTTATSAVEDAERAHLAEEEFQRREESRMAGGREFLNDMN
jgi:hypothetical protein